MVRENPFSTDEPILTGHLKVYDEKEGEHVFFRGTEEKMNAALDDPKMDNPEYIDVKHLWPETEDDYEAAELLEDVYEADDEDMDDTIDWDEDDEWW